MRAVKVYSLNYDFVPTIAYGDKCLWADIRWPAPEDLRIGTKIDFISSSKDLVMPSATFKVYDIVGSRVIISCSDPKASTAMLTYFKAKNDRYPLPETRNASSLKASARNEWSPLDHGSLWGYATRDLANPNPAADRNWTYGNGDSVLMMTW